MGGCFRDFAICLIFYLSFPILNSHAKNFTCTKQAETDGNGKVHFENIKTSSIDVKLPQEYDAKGLQAFFNLANSFMNTVQPKSVMEGFPDVNISDIKFDDKTKEKLIDYETSVAVAVVFGLLFALIMPVVGCCFCCCRCCNKCGGKMIQSEKESKKHHKCFFMTAILSILTIFMLCGVLFMFVTNQRLGEAVEQVETKYTGTVNGAVKYTENIVGEIKQIYENQLPCIFDLLGNLLSDANVRTDIGVPLQDRIRENVSSLIDLAFVESENVTGIAMLLSKIKSATVELKTLGGDLENKIDNIKTNIDAADTKCQASSIPADKCIGLNQITVKTSTNYTDLPDISAQQNEIESVLTKNMTGEVIKADNVIKDIPKTVLEKSKTARANLRNKINDARTKVREKLEDLTEDATKKINDTKAEFLKKVPTIPDFTKFDKYRSYGFSGLSGVVGIIFLFMGAGLVLGIFGYNKRSDSWARSNIATCGGHCLMASVGFMFIFSFFLMLVTVVMFVIGTHVHVVCKDLRDGKLIDHLGSSTLTFNDEQISVVDILAECKRNKPIFAAVNGERFYNLTEKLQFRDNIDDLDTLIDSISFDLSDQTIFTSDLGDILTKLSTSSVQSINFQEFLDKAQSKITESNLTEAATNISRIANDVRPVDNALADDLDDIASRLNLLVNNTVEKIRRKLTSLDVDVRDLQKLSENLAEKAENFIVKFKQSAKFITNETLEIVKELLKKYTDLLLGYIDQGFAHVVNQLNTNIGKCKPVWHLYNGVVNTYLCDNLTQNLNGFWLSLGWCLLFFIPCIILSVKVAKFYRRMKYDVGLDPDDHPPCNNENYQMSNVSPPINDESHLIRNHPFIS